MRRLRAWIHRKQSKAGKARDDGIESKARKARDDEKRGIRKLESATSAALQFLELDCVGRAARGARIPRKRGSEAGLGMTGRDEGRSWRMWGVGKNYMHG